MTASEVETLKRLETAKVLLHGLGGAMAPGGLLSSSSRTGSTSRSTGTARQQQQQQQQMGSVRAGPAETAPPPPPVLEEDSEEEEEEEEEEQVGRTGAGTAGHMVMPCVTAACPPSGACLADRPRSCMSPLHRQRRGA
jgi:hypothetical protein